MCGFLRDLNFRNCQSEEDIQVIASFVKRDLSETYDISSYRYFWKTWPEFVIFVCYGEKIIGCILSKINYPGVRYRINTGTSDEEGEIRECGIGLVDD
jgi:hypothetical protein